MHRHGQSISQESAQEAPLLSHRIDTFFGLVSIHKPESTFFGRCVIFCLPASEKGKRTLKNSACWYEK
jgi:hypothetical protein